MSHSLYKIWIHGVWSTKNRDPLIIPSVEEKIHQLIRNEFQNLKCPIRAVNGIEDHVHCLFRSNPRMALTDIFQFVKGGVSHTINQQELIIQKFAWQTGLAAFSVSESELNRVVNYIDNQKIHHKKMTFEEEFNELLRLHGHLPIYLPG